MPLRAGRLPTGAFLFSGYTFGGFGGAPCVSVTTSAGAVVVVAVGGGPGSIVVVVTMGAAGVLVANAAVAVSSALFLSSDPLLELK